MDFTSGLQGIDGAKSFAAWMRTADLRGAARMLRAMAWTDVLARRRTRATAQKVSRDWTMWAEDAQRAPEGDWRTWLFMGGRGAGKTRAGAEWVRQLVERGEARRIALVGPTLNDVREVMIEGPSGLRAVATEELRPVYVSSRRRLEWPSGAAGYVFSAEDPDSLRGPQFDAAWCDEIGAWAHDVATWDMLMFGLRLGSGPRVAATTTPRPSELVMRLTRLTQAGLMRAGLAQATSVQARSAEGGRGVVMTRAATHANAHNLSPDFVAAITDLYRGTRLERQELEGELISQTEGALFSLALIEAGRVSADDAGPFDRLVVAVDPPATHGEDAAACGIVAAGVRAGVVYVLDDVSEARLRPAEWARRAAALARKVGAGTIVAESNQGGDMVREVLEQAGAGGLRVKMVHAGKSKRARAEPVSAAYESGKVRHAGVFRALEDEMVLFGGGGENRMDRVDALVWAVTELLGPKLAPPKATGL